MDKNNAEKKNPGLSIETKTRRRVGRPKKSWEDDTYQFAKPDDTEETRGSDLKNNDTWLNAAKDQKRWKEIGKDFSITHKAAQSTKNTTDDKRLTTGAPSSQTQEGGALGEAPGGREAYRAFIDKRAKDAAEMSVPYLRKRK